MVEGRVVCGGLGGGVVEGGLPGEFPCCLCRSPFAILSIPSRPSTEAALNFLTSSASWEYLQDPVFSNLSQRPSLANWRHTGPWACTGSGG